MTCVTHTLNWINRRYIRRIKARRLRYALFEFYAVFWWCDFAFWRCLCYGLFGEFSGESGGVEKMMFIYINNRKLKINHQSAKK